MKVFTRKEFETLSLVTPRHYPKQKPVQFPAPTTLERSVGGLRQVKNETLRPQLSGAEIKRRLSLLSVVDVMRVNRATIREGKSHCVWPPEILKKFRLADVITEKSAPHYVLREMSVARIK